jgi:uncharacterized protein YhfF
MESGIGEAIVGWDDFRNWPWTSLAAMQRYRRYRRVSGLIEITVNRSLMTRKDIGRSAFWVWKCLAENTIDPRWLDVRAPLTAFKSESTLFAMEWQHLETFSFGDGPDLANRLLELVLSGTKRATCWAESQGLLSAEVGKLMVVLDGQGVPKAVLKTIELTKRRFDEVDEAFAYDEGEGDRSLQYWREAHARYFSRLGRYAPDMMLWCERFELVERIGRVRWRLLSCRFMAVRPEGANHQWRKIPPGELSIDPVANERLGWVTGRAGASW